MKTFCLILVLLLPFLPLSSAVADEEHSHKMVATEKLGTVHFPVSCNEAAQKQFEHGLALLHSFSYGESRKAFEEIAVTDPNCAMAYWGTAMSLYHPLWGDVPPPPDMQAGSEAIEKAKALQIKTDREKDYIEAIGTFYKDSDKVDHPTRVLTYEKAMEQLYQKYPQDREAAIFYALALNGSALVVAPMDKTLAKQRKAGEILEKIFAEQPDHPGVTHYIIHSYDYPPLANRALSAARRYAQIAPSAPHALHMPSHIFTRLGLWDESIASNRAAAEAGKAYALKMQMKETWSQPLHAMDYLTYAYLQRGEDQQAKAVLEETMQVTHAEPALGAAYALAAIPARYAVERHQWADAAALSIHPADFPWEKYPWPEAVTHFARALGSSHTGDKAAAAKEVEKLQSLHQAMMNSKQAYLADQIEILHLEASAWLAHAQGKNEDALNLMRSAADLEDSAEKHPVTPGSIIPARELLGDLLLESKQPAQALTEYETSMTAVPNRFNGLHGAAQAAKFSGNSKKAEEYYSKLVQLCDSHCQRPELQEAKAFLAKK